MTFSSKKIIDLHFLEAHGVRKTKNESVLNENQSFSPKIANVVSKNQLLRQRFKCSICDLDFAYESGLKNHTLSVHARRGNPNNVNSNNHNVSHNIQVSANFIHEESNVSNNTQEPFTNLGDLFLF